MSSKKLIKPILPTLFGISFIGDEQQSKDYYKGCIHAVIPYVILLFIPVSNWFILAAFVYFCCVTFLYCTVFKQKKDGYFFTHGLILFAVLFYVILKVS